MKAFIIYASPTPKPCVLPQNYLLEILLLIFYSFHLSFTITDQFFMMWMDHNLFSHYYPGYCQCFVFFLFQRERNGERERDRQRDRKRDIVEREKYRLLASCTFLTGDRTHNLGMHRDWESKPQPLGAMTQSHTGQAYRQSLSKQPSKKKLKCVHILNISTFISFLLENSQKEKSW